MLGLPIIGELPIGIERFAVKARGSRVELLLVSPISQLQSLTIVTRRLAANHRGQTLIECSLCGIIGRQFVQFMLGRSDLLVFSEGLGGRNQTREVAPQELPIHGVVRVGGQGFFLPGAGLPQLVAGLAEAFRGQVERCDVAQRGAHPVSVVRYLGMFARSRSQIASALACDSSAWSG